MTRRAAVRDHLVAVPGLDGRHEPFGAQRAGLRLARTALRPGSGIAAGQAGPRPAAGLEFVEVDALEARAQDGVAAGIVPGPHADAVYDAAFGGGKHAPRPVAGPVP